jgi:predicted regulator of Ras-like GTPase activity (Roadblock/LC7/MglB family)
VIHVEAELGHLMLRPVSPEILLVAITDSEANLGLLRLALADAAERLD